MTQRQATMAVASLVMLAKSLVYGQDPIRLLPNNYHLVFENSLVQVIKVKYAPHEKLPIHNHSDKPTVYVYLTDSGPVRFSHVEAHAFTLVRPPEKAGTFHVSPGRMEKHEVENLGDVQSESLRVELKQVPLGSSAIAFRGVKPFDLKRSCVSSQFPGPFVRVQRVIAAEHDTIESGNSERPALLIALSPTLVQLEVPEPNKTLLTPGEVLWIGAHRRYRMKGADEQAAGHLLQITFLPTT